MKSHVPFRPKRYPKMGQILIISRMNWVKCRNFEFRLIFSWGIRLLGPMSQLPKCEHTYDVTWSQKYLTMDHMLIISQQKWNKKSKLCNCEVKCSKFPECDLLVTSRCPLRLENTSKISQNCFYLNLAMFSMYRWIANLCWFSITIESGCES